MPSLNAKDFDLSHTLECGQVFRWKKEGNAYYGIINNLPTKLEQKENKIIYNSYNSRLTKNSLRSFLGLNDSLPKILKTINKDRYIARAIRKYNGLRIIRQEPWECLASYITSSQSNIPKINFCLNLLAERFGKRLEFDGRTFYVFPPAKILAKQKLKSLKLCSLGFHADYLLKAAKLFKPKMPESLSAMHYSDAKSRLMEFPGIGPKVADCVLLYSLGFANAFPVDRWIKKAMSEWYFPKEEHTEEQINHFARRYFYPYAGYAQQYLFYARRNEK